MEEYKKCSSCKLDLPANKENFNYRYDRGKLKGICKKCQSDYKKKHYEDNKKEYMQKSFKYKQDFKLWFTEIKNKLKCSLCNEDRYWVLDFHHTNPNEKDGNVSVMISNCNKSKIISEMEKCIVLCSNCHRDLHHKEKSKTT